MAGVKKLAGETAVYGVSSILGRFLNWCLVPLYVYIFPAAQYGIVSYLYAFTAVALVVLNYGMETGFFRFANKHDRPMDVYTTSMTAVGFTSLLFMLLITLFILPVSEALRLPHHPEYVWMLGITVALDAFANIPFAYLRFKSRAMRFASIKLINVGLNIFLNIFFILCCPWIQKECPAAIGWFYPQLGGEAFGIGWIFVANILSTLVVLLMLLPEIGAARRGSFDGSMLRRMLSYSWPLLILGIAGIMSQNMGQMIIPYLFDNQQHAREMVGIYGANIKIAIVMVMFTQAFRYAYEPFIFAQAGSKSSDRTSPYCDAMKYFVIFGLFIFLGVMYFLPVLRHFVAKPYWQGLDVVPVMMLAELCFGIFFNLSLWYKLTDRTRWGMYFSVGGFIIMLALNLVLVPAIGYPGGYMGSAWAALVAYFIIMVASWLIGRKYYPLPYPIRRIGFYTLLAAALWGVGHFIPKLWDSMALTYILRTLLLIIYAGIVLRRENLPIPGLRRAR